ncbi:MAG TPA: hypothetical protein VIH69_05640 [Dehalococcoidia bacterium]
MTIHAYSSDHGERTRILIVIGLLSVVAAWLLHLVLGYLPVAVPWWIDMPSVLGFFALIRTTFDKTLWKNKIVRKVLGITIPDLNGSWKGLLLSSYTGQTIPHDAELMVVQSWTTILISLETTTSISRSQTAAFVLDQPPGLSLKYEYLCEPRPNAKETVHTHRGTAELRVKSSGTLLEGDYYTGRDRQTYGTLKFQRESRA